MADSESNSVAVIAIEQEKEKQVTKLLNPDLADDKFFLALHGLCILDRMAESHQK